jgi:hypothetical protein
VVLRTGSKEFKAMQRLLTLLLAAGLVVLAGKHCLAAQPPRPTPGPYRPFSAQIKTTYLDEEAAETVFVSSFHRRADGSYARMGETEAFGERGTFHWILDARERTWIDVDSFVGAVLVFPLVSDSKYRSLLEEPGTCARLSDGTWTRVGGGEMLGMKVIDIELPYSSRRKAKMRVAPELECFPLLDLLIENGVAVTRIEVVSLDLGDPDPAAFHIPPGFREVSPMQFEELYQKRFRGGSYFGTEEAARQEREYQEAKAIRARQRK